MKLTAATRLIATYLMLISLLFTQLAMASYICPIAPSKTPTTNITDVAAHTVSTPCHQQDLNQPGLCHAHASDAAYKLSLDKPDVPNVPVFLPIYMAQTIRVSDASPAARHSSRWSRVAMPSAALPATILHCCFRI